ncbi:MAG: abortive infection family protein [bacterium]|nr:abortive infection family protein [bacterium]
MLRLKKARFDETIIPLPENFRRPNLSLARMKLDAPPNKVRIALSRCASATMTESQWRELSELISDEAATWVDMHPRFLPSLRWGDDDHDGLVLEFFRKFLGGELEHLDVCLEFLDLETWLEEYDPKLYVELYPGSPLEVPREVDLTDLPAASAIRENLNRLRGQLSAGDSAAAIGTAKDLIESTAKVILTAEGQPIGHNQNMDTLIKRAHEIVNLHAQTVNNADPQVQAAVKRIRGGLQSVALGVVDLRNAAGTGHGRATIGPSALPDEALLAAEAAATWIRSILAAYAKLTGRTI